MCGPNLTGWVAPTYKDLDADGTDERYYLGIDPDTGEIWLELFAPYPGLPVYSENLVYGAVPSGGEVWTGDLTGDGKSELVACATQAGAGDSLVDARVLSNHSGTWQLVFTDDQLDDGVIEGNSGSVVATESFELLAGKCSWHEHSTYEWTGSTFSFASVVVEVVRSDDELCDSIIPEGRNPQ